MFPGATCSYFGGGSTVMIFTRSIKKLTNTQNAILTGRGNITNYIYAYGTSTTFAYHGTQSRGSKAIDMSADSVTKIDKLVSVTEDKAQSTVETTLNFVTTKLQSNDKSWIKIVPPGLVTLSNSSRPFLGLSM